MRLLRSFSSAVSQRAEYEGTLAFRQRLWRSMEHKIAPTLDCVYEVDESREPQERGGKTRLDYVEIERSRMSSNVRVESPEGLPSL